MFRLSSTKIVLFLFFLAALDATILPAFQINSVAPNFLYLFICYAAYEWGSSKTLYVAFWVGLMRDFLGGGVLGIEATILVGLAFALDFVVRKIERQFPGIYFLITFLFIFLAGSLRLFLGFFGAVPVEMLGAYEGSVVLMALYTSALLPVFNILADHWFGRVSAKQYELFRR